MEKEEKVDIRLLSERLCQIGIDASGDILLYVVEEQGIVAGVEAVFAKNPFFRNIVHHGITYYHTPLEIKPGTGIGGLMIAGDKF